jgi:hypothetical protein
MQHYPEMAGQRVFHPVGQFGRDWTKALTLSTRQVTALLRFWHGERWADGRSVRALKSKRLAVRVEGASRDVPFPVKLTDFGVLVAAWLEDNGFAEGKGHTLLGKRFQ